MDTKLKNSTKREAELLIAWIIWGMLFTVTANYFTTIGTLAPGRTFEYAKVITIAGALGSVISGAVLFMEAFHYWSAVWQTERNKSIILDKVPFEIWFVLTAYLGLYWLEEKLFSPADYLYVLPDWYLAVSGAVRSISHQLFWLLALGLAAWGLMRQLFYGCWEEFSLIHKIRIWCTKVCGRYHVCSALGKKLTRKRWLFWLSVLVAVLAVGMAALLLYAWEYDLAVISGGIALLAGVYIIAYQVFSGVTSRGVTTLVEQIGAISRAEPLDESHKISERSIFYEPFHQLEQLEEAVQNSARKQIQAERLKIDLITNVSHDLKTPLTSMVGYIDLLKQEELSPEAKDYIDVISQKQELLKEMIQNLFELSKSTSGVEELHMETLDMRKLLEQILGDMENTIQESGMTIRTTFDDPPLLFSGDNEKMYRVVQNLLENALKYSLENTRIYVDVKREGERLLLQMKNIAKYEMDFDAEEITGRFVRGDRARTTEGHGLGLAIASSFTQNMGGTLDVEVDGDLFKVKLEFPAILHSDS